MFTTFQADSLPAELPGKPLLGQGLDEAEESATQKVA